MSVNANPESIRAVAAAATQFAAALQAAKDELVRSVATAREGWQDSKGVEASGRVQQLVDGINVSEELKAISDLAEAQASKLEAYLADNS